MKPESVTRICHTIFKALALLTILSMLGFGQPPAVQAAAPATPPAKPVWDQCFGPDARLDFHELTGKVSHVGTLRGRPVHKPGTDLLSATPEEAARAYLGLCGSFFGLDAQTDDVSLAAQHQAVRARAVVRVQQLHRGIPVFAGELVIQLNPTNEVVAVNGELLPNIQLNLKPRMPAAQARAAALRAVKADLNGAAGMVIGNGPINLPVQREAEIPNADTNSLIASDPELWIYNPELITNQPGTTSLVWRVEVRSADLAPIRYLVLIDAHDGSILLNINQVDTVKNRLTYTANNGTTMPGSLLCDEANPDCTGGDKDAVSAHVYTGDTYDFYLDSYGRDSLDGAGMSLISSVHYSNGYCNAFWNGFQVAYGDGCFIAADDIVGHELTHGVTQYTSDLVYAYESGAISESFSDYWGEMIDQGNGDGTDTPEARWYVGEDASIGALRYMKNPPDFQDADRMGSPYYFVGTSDNGGVHTNSGVNNKAAYLITDGDTFNGYVITGLGSTKAAQIYYEVQTNILTSGASYHDLGHGLYQACTNLIDSFEITSDDCTQVQNATLATEMITTSGAPWNDDFDAATALPGTPYFTPALDTTLATNAADDPLLSCTDETGANTVWYKYTPSLDGDFVLDTFSSDYDTVLQVWTGTRGSLTSIACNDDDGSLQSKLSFAATGGVTYYIEVASYASGGGTLVLHITVGPPSNDDFDAPVVIDALPYTSPTLDVTGATTAADDPVLTCAGSPRYRTVWYSYTPSADGDLVVDTFTSSFDTVLGAFTGTRGSLTLLACNDDYLDRQSRVTFAATSGVTYYFEVASYSSGGGLLTLHADLYTPVPTGWVLKTPMTVGRSRPAAASVDGLVYVIGGESLGTAIPDSKVESSAAGESALPALVETRVEVYDPESDSWSTVSPKPTAVENTGAATIDGLIYVPGGWTGSAATTVVEVYDPGENSWSTSTPLPVATYGHAVAAIGSKLYIVGGTTGGGPVTTCRVLDLDAGGDWSTCGNMHYARSFAGAGVVDDKLYIVGGLDGSGTNLAFLEELTPPSTWTIKTPMATSRGGPGVAGYGDTLYACGGGWTSYHDTCEKYSPAANAWSTFDHLNVGRRTLAMVLAGNRLYAEAGWGGSYLPVNETIGLPPSISGNVGVAGATLTYDDGGVKTAVSDSNGDYSFFVTYDWSGTVTPSKTDHTFLPADRTYANVKLELPNHNYTALIDGAPQILNFSPEDGGETGVLPSISLTLLLTDLVRGAGSFYPDTVVLKLDGQSVIGDSTIAQTAGYPATHASITYAPPTNLAFGPHEVIFIYPSPAGLLVRHWNFTVLAPFGAAPPQTIQIGTVR